MSAGKAEVSTFPSAISPNSKHWLKSCISRDAQALQGQTTGCHLLKLQLMDSAAVLPKPKHTWLPILTVLFLLSYGLMTMLVVEQGHTIDAQRNLIRQLFSDSTELTSMKGNANTQKQKALMQGQPPAAPMNPNGAGPNSSAQATAPQGKDKHNMRKFVMPKPPRDASEMADERRS